MGRRGRRRQLMWRIAGLFLCLTLFFPGGSATLGAADGSVNEAPPPLRLKLHRVGEGLEVKLQMMQALPSAFIDTLPSGAVVTVAYPMRLRRRRWWLWDGSLWKGELISRTAFDPITGRYRCELLLDEIIIASEERDTADEAGRWLSSPPAFRVVVDGLDSPRRLYFKVRAVFSTSTTLLVFPNSTGTEWLSVPLVGGGTAEELNKPERTAD